MGMIYRLSLYRKSEYRVRGNASDQPEALAKTSDERWGAPVAKQLIQASRLSKEEIERFRRTLEGWR